MVDTDACQRVNHAARLSEPLVAISEKAETSKVPSRVKLVATIRASGYAKKTPKKIAGTATSQRILGFLPTV